jgi:hypothetical protein
MRNASNFIVHWRFFMPMQNGKRENWNLKMASIPSILWTIVLGIPLATQAVEVIDNRVIDNRFEILENGSQIRDIKTKLIWQRCSVGQKWDGITCTGKAKNFAFDDARNIGVDGWRIPEKEELLGIVDGRVPKPTINHKAFPNTPASDFWTNTSYLSFTPKMWFVNFDFGLASHGDIYSPCAVRLVRTD